MRLPFRKVPRIWIHAMSLGEYNAARPLINALYSRYKGMDIILSASTRTGIDAIERDWTGGTDRVTTTAFPIDLFFVTRKFARMIRPDCFLLIETDIWPNIMADLKAVGSRILLVNGSISSRAASRLSVLPGAASFLYGNFSFLCMQSRDDAKRMESLGIDKEKIDATGNIKLDIKAPPIDSAKRARLLGLTGFKRNALILCAGSTHAPEERTLLKMFLSLRGNHPDLRLILAPRDTKRNRRVAKLCSSLGLDFSLRSEKTGPNDPDVFILDTLGELTDFYSLCFAAFVGGTLAPVGGHNLLEPVSLGKPVFFGPNVESCREIAHALENAGAGKMVLNGAHLETAMGQMLSDRQAYERACLAASEFSNANKGVTEKYLEIISRFMPHDIS